MSESAQKVDQIAEQESAALNVAEIVNGGGIVDESSVGEISGAVGRKVAPRRNVVLDAAKIKAAVLADRPLMPKKPAYPAMIESAGKRQSFEIAVRKYWKDMAKYEADMKIYEYELAQTDAVRPKTRGECEGGVRPCPHVGCSQNLYLHVNPDNGHITMNFPELEPDEMHPEFSCALDVAGGEGLTFEEIATALNVTRDAVRQIEQLSIGKLRDEMDKQDLGYSF